MLTTDAMSRKYLLEPEVPGELGERTLIDTTQWPPVVSVLHLDVFGWLGDSLLACHPVFMVTPKVAHALTSAEITGVNFADLEVTANYVYKEMQPGKPLPELLWMQITGEGDMDVTTNDRANLYVSERCLAVLRRSARLDHCAVTPA